MVKIMMHGCNGVMGQVISKIVEETEGAVMACGVDRVMMGTTIILYLQISMRVM